MRVFKFYCDGLYYGYAAQTEEAAIEKFNEDIGQDFSKCEEIPENEWDNIKIKMWEDNDYDKEPFEETIREAIVGTEPQQIFSNDY